MADEQTISHNGLALIQNFEGCKLTAYRDSANVPTIGYGHTSAAGAPAVHDGMEITQGEAETILSNDLEKFEGYVLHYVKVPLTQNQFDALVSFVYNLGPGNFAKSTLLRDVNAGEMVAAKAQFARWTRASGRVLSGLVRRRAAEAALFGTPDAGAPQSPAPSPVAAAPDVPADILADVTSGISSIVADTIGPIIAPAGPLPGIGVSQPAADTESTPMNPFLLIQIIQQVMTYAPQVEHIIGNMPDIIAKGQAAIAALEKLDLATAEVDAKAIFSDIGITQAQVAQVVSHATQAAPPTTKAA